MRPTSSASLDRVPDPGAPPRVPFGKRVVELGLATPQQVVAGLRLQAERSAQGVFQNLGQILVEQRALNPQQVRDILAGEFYTIMACPVCSERYNVSRDHKGEMSCPADGTTLHPAEEAAGIGVAATLHAGDSPVGLELGGCRIVELIGRGAMGAVYKAKHLGLNRYVAIKVLPSSSRDETFERRLMTEARAIARLEHPGIVQVYDVGCEKGYFFMVMQLLRGQTLEDRIAEFGIPDLRGTLETVNDVAQGLAAAHKAGVIHRDLKPANIIVTEDGRARLTDFGLARLGGTKDELGDQIVGTPTYMAPEQWLRGEIDGRTDLYSLGVIFYQLATGRKPFEGRTVAELMEQHLNVRAKAPRSIDSTLTPGVQAVLGKMMAKSPDRRYPDLPAFLEDLARLLQDKDPKALEETGRYLKCGFCETLNPKGSTQCKVCGEGLGAEATGEIDLAVREGETRCGSCGEVGDGARRACARCGKPL